MAFNQAIARGKIKVTCAVLLVGASLRILSVSASTALRPHALCVCQLGVGYLGVRSDEVCPQTQALTLVPAV